MRLIQRCSFSLLTLLVITVIVACTNTAAKTPVVPETPTVSVSITVPDATATPTPPPKTPVSAVVPTPTPFSVTAVPVVPMIPTPCELTMAPTEPGSETPSARTPVPDWFLAPTPSVVPMVLGADGRRSSCRPNEGGFTDLIEGVPGFHLLGTRFAEHFVEWTADGSRIILGYDGAVWAVGSAGSKLQMVADANPGYRPFGYPAVPFGLYADVSSIGCRIVYSTCQFITEHPSFFRSTFELFQGSGQKDRVLFHYEIATVNIDGGNLPRLTDNEWIDHFPTWSPEGSRIAFIAERHRGITDAVEGSECWGNHKLYTMNADGSGLQFLAPTYKQSLTVTNAFIVHPTPPQWSPNGRRLAFIMDEDGGESDCRLRQRGLYTVTSDGRVQTVGDDGAF